MTLSAPHSMSATRLGGEVLALHAQGAAARGRVALRGSLDGTQGSGGVRASAGCQQLHCGVAPGGARRRRRRGAHPNQAKKRGDCQWVMPGMMCSSTSCMELMQEQAAGNRWPERSRTAP